VRISVGVAIDDSSEITINFRKPAAAGRRPFSRFLSRRGRTSTV
jgi:hypothetical protein